MRRAESTAVLSGARARTLLGPAPGSAPTALARPPLQSTSGSSSVAAAPRGAAPRGALTREAARSVHRQGRVFPRKCRQRCPGRAVRPGKGGRRYGLSTFRVLLGSSGQGLFKHLTVGCGIRRGPGGHPDQQPCSDGESGDTGGSQGSGAPLGSNIPQAALALGTPWSQKLRSRCRREETATQGPGLPLPGQPQ